ncbi:small glutamine-rich tetratricopeptide repeat-containing protein beta-like [Pectinophora gossypiella]|uniref:small glutamine-rich tetratricopeptide repeat-containing protein beta-like n=1 Tax=Pectinophora gossypiella TaxID=13191 RepID=UPI00214E74CE|nr:small glutamine-rich tetratricopeptide repeat-containing protein beta-like [Pectinophora gossypiella]
MSEVKIIAASIVNFLKQQLEGDTLSVDSRESVEVGVQCIETAFELSPEDAAKALDLLQLVRQQHSRAEPPVDSAEAERLKNEGNVLMKAGCYREALENYSRAIELDPRNSVYLCNRAAAHFKLGQHEDAVADCTAALALQPNYVKAHGRLGLALTALERHREARAAYARAAQLEPDNESYRQNLRLTDERLAQRGERPPLDLGGLLQNPALLNMATEMLADPNMQNLISGLMNNATATGNGAGGAGGMSALFEAGQALAQHMQAANPDLVDQLRRQVRPPGPGGNPPSSQ